MRVLVLGGTQFIGPHVVRCLVAQGREVAVFHRGQTQAELPASVRRLHGDRRRLAEHADKLRGFAPHVVVDMVAFTEDDARALVSTFRGIARRAVVLSSGDVYRAFGIFSGREAGPPEPLPLSEDAPLRQSFYLARGPDSRPEDDFHDYEKILVERVVQGDPALPATVLRLPMVHGPGDPRHRLWPYLSRMDAGRSAILLNEGLAGWHCPRGYVEDVARAVALAVTDPRTAGRIYNVAEPIAHTEADWVARVGRAAGWSGRVILVPRDRLPVPYFTEQDLIMDSTRIRTELGYGETIDADLALHRTIAWERAHPPAQSVDDPAQDALLAEREGSQPGV